MSRSRQSADPAVSAVIVEHGDAEVVYACVDVLGRWSDPGRSIEVVIVEDGVPELVRPRIGAGVLRVRSRESNRGHVAAANEGAACSRAGFLMFVDPHVGLSRSDLASLLQALETDGRLAAVGPASATTEAPRTALRAFARVIDRLAPLAGAGAVRRADEPVPAAWLPGATLVVRADVFRALGGFDESLCEHAAAEDWCRRARRRGYEVARVACETAADATAAAESRRAPWRPSRECCLEGTAAVLERHLGRTVARAFRSVAVAGRTWRRLTAVRIILPRRAPDKARGSSGMRAGRRAEGPRVAERRLTARKPDALRP